jgi:predicted transcriptional regulator
MMDRKNLKRTADVVAAHVGNNPVAAGQLPQLINSIFKSFAQLGASPPSGERTPAVPVASSVTKDAIVCLECGAKYKSLKRHLLRRHGLAPDDYRQRWDLGSHYPMITRGYSAQRAEQARQNGLGRRRGASAEVATTEPATQPPSDLALQRPADVLAGDACTPFAPEHRPEGGEEDILEDALGSIREHGPDGRAGPAHSGETGPAACLDPHDRSLPV